MPRSFITRRRWQAGSLSVRPGEEREEKGGERGRERAAARPREGDETTIVVERRRPVSLCEARSGGGGCGDDEKEDEDDEDEDEDEDDEDERGRRCGAIVIVV